MASVGEAGDDAPPLGGARRGRGESDDAECDRNDAVERSDAADARSYQPGSTLATRTDAM
jgi:hypothetical protein